MDRRLLDYSPTLETFDSAGLESESARMAPARATSVLGETTEMALAAELLGVTSEAALEGFLTNVVARVGAAGARLVRTRLGQALIAALKRAAQPILSVQHSALGGPVIDALGVQHQHRLVARAAQQFGLELEGLSPEDKEFALAQQFVRFAAAAARHALSGRGEPQAVARHAVQRAALKHAPGLLAHPGPRPGEHGRWVRRGDRIVVLDC